MVNKDGVSFLVPASDKDMTQTESYEKREEARVNPHRASELI